MVLRPNLRTVIVAAYLAVGIVQALPQSSSAPAIGTKNSQVRVDVIATDRKDRYITDLSAADLQLWEDGKKQRIDSFQFGNTVPSQKEPDQCYTVLFFDLSHLGDAELSASRIAASDLLRISKKSSQVIAAMAFAGSLRLSQNFTSNSDALRYALDNLKSRVATSAGGSDSTMAAREALAIAAYNYASPDIFMALRNIADNVAEIDGRKILIVFGARFAMTAETRSELTAAINACNTANLAVYVIDARAVLRSQGANGFLHPVVFLIPFANGFQSNSSPSLGGSAPNGLNSSPSSQSSTEQLSFTPDKKVDPLQWIAEATGGFVARSAKNLVEAMQNIEDEQSGYYLIRYSPPPSAPGTCHSLKVKVLRGGVHARTRTGYCTTKPQDELAGTSVEKLLKAQTASTGAGNLTASMQLPYFFRSLNKARVDLTMDIAPSAIVLHKSKGNYAGSINILGVAYDGAGAVAAKFSDEVNLNLDSEGAFEQFGAQPYRYKTRFEIASGKYQVKVVFTSDGTRFGKLQMPLEIDDYDGSSLGLSSVVLSSDFHPIRAAKPVEFRSGELAGPAPLVSRGMEILPMGENIWRASEIYALYVEVYDRWLKEAFVEDGGGLKVRPPQIGLSVQVLNLQTGQKKLDTGFMNMQDYIESGNPAIPIALKLPLSNLITGHYRVYVRANDSRERLSPLHSADFEVK